MPFGAGVSLAAIMAPNWSNVVFEGQVTKNQHKL